MSKQDSGKVVKYELMLILKPTLPDAQRKQLLSKIDEDIKRFGGSVEEEQIWGKRYMAYPIKKFSEGYYLVNNIQLLPENSKEFVRLLNINSDVLRHMLRKVESFEKISLPTEKSR